MNPAGIFLVIAGVWVIAQVLSGDALERLAILPGSQPASDGGKSDGNGGGGIPKSPIPDIPLVPQGPLTKIPFFPISSAARP